VRAHGGEIRAVAREGGGAEFTFTLPISPTASSSASGITEAPHRAADGLQPSS
jgi:hypothetical protein